VRAREARGIGRRSVRDSNPAVARLKSSLPHLEQTLRGDPSGCCPRFCGSRDRRLSWWSNGPRGAGYEDRTRPSRLRGGFGPRPNRRRLTEGLELLKQDLPFGLVYSQVPHLAAYARSKSGVWESNPSCLFGLLVCLCGVSPSELRGRESNPQCLSAPG
jgi:hypothetical protein